MIRAAFTLAVLAVCSSPGAKPTVSSTQAAERVDDITHLQVVIEMAYDDACPVQHRFVVYVDGVERGVVEPACKPRTQMINGRRMVVTDSGTQTADIAPFDVPPGVHRVSARDTIAGWVAAEKPITFPQREPNRSDIKLEILPIRFGFDVNEEPKHYVGELVYSYVTM